MSIFTRTPNIRKIVETGFGVFDKATQYASNHTISKHASSVLKTAKNYASKHNISNRALKTAKKYASSGVNSLKTAKNTISKHRSKLNNTKKYMTRKKNHNFIDKLPIFEPIANGSFGIVFHGIPDRPNPNQNLTQSVTKAFYNKKGYNHEIKTNNTVNKIITSQKFKIK